MTQISEDFQEMSMTQSTEEIHGHGGRSEDMTRTFTEEIEDGETVEDFLGILTCTGCGKHFREHC